jgi:hypothetical protein
MRTIARFLPDLMVDSLLGTGSPTFAAPTLEQKHQEEVVAARAEGEALGRAMAEAEASQRQVILRAEWEAAATAERSAWVEQHSSACAESFAAQLAAQADDITAALVATLQPFVLHWLPALAAQELAVTLKQAVADDLATGIVLKGPPDLTAAISAKLQAAGVQVANESAGTDEILAHAGQTRAATHITRCLAAIAEAAR